MKIPRDRYLNQLIERKNNGFVKVITGIRRCGKSYLMNTLFYDHLISAGIKRSHIIKFAFDSAKDLDLIGEELLELSETQRKVDPKKFIKYIQGKIKEEGTYYLLLDEVQLLGNFEAVLNCYLREDSIDVYVTGSNSKFLSHDVLTEFAGRGDEIHVLPLVFSEFCKACDGSVEEALEDYMVYGGLPQVALMSNGEQKALYLETQIKNLYFRDMVNRHNLSGDKHIGELFDILASGISTLVNPKKLADTFRSVKGGKLCEATISNYIDIMEDAFLIKRSNRYDIKGKKYINTPYKIYFEDIGLRNARLNFRQVERTHIMENIVFNELRYRGYKVDVGVVVIRRKNTDTDKEERKYLEIDFVANKGYERVYVQCAYDIPDDEKWEQETRSFDNTRDSFRKVIVVRHPVKRQMNENGYLVVGLKEFLSDANALIFT